jgi:hypothetical protein
MKKISIILIVLTIFGCTKEPIEQKPTTQDYSSHRCCVYQCGVRCSNKCKTNLFTCEYHLNNSVKCCWCQLSGSYGIGNYSYCEEHYYEAKFNQSDCSSTRCKGNTQLNVRCNNQTTNCCGYCYLHTSQANWGGCTIVQCSKIFTTTNKQCTNNTSNCNGKCYLHQ